MSQRTLTLHNRRFFSIGYVCLFVFQLCGGGEISLSLLGFICWSAFNVQTVSCFTRCPTGCPAYRSSHFFVLFSGPYFNMPMTNVCLYIILNIIFWSSIFKFNLWFEYISWYLVGYIWFFNFLLPFGLEQHD